ncbi:MAG TPA: hypothetical protein VEX41_03725 [Candidatus Eisenbacteria bacterium]|nr:hypothetical protein [Candidatus Eisenbacteria bacterium]
MASLTLDDERRVSAAAEKKALDLGWTISGRAEFRAGQSSCRSR